MPPVPVGLLLLGALLGIVAAAGPCVVFKSSGVEELSIILDRGASMAVDSGKPFRGVLERCADRLGALSPGTRVTLVPVPGPAIVTSGDQWFTVARQLSPTVARTNLDQAINNQLRTTRGPVIVLSDQKIDRADSRVIQIVPEKAGDAVAIALLSARALPRAQVMVRIENHSDRASVELVVRSGRQMETRQVALPDRGGSVDVFVDMKELGDVVTAKLAGEAGPWGQAWAAQAAAGVRLATDSDLDDAVKKMAAVYAVDRPARIDAPRVVVTSRMLKDDESGVCVQAGPAGGIAGEATVMSGPLTEHVQSWPAAGPAKIPPGFVPVVSTQPGVVVAMRDQPRRAVFVNANLLDWEKSEDFVIFFANVFDWLAGGQPGFTAIDPVELGGDWESAGDGNAAVTAGEWPGLYRSRSSGKTIAVNAGAYPVVDQGADSPAAAFSKTGVGFRRITDWCLFAALLSCLCAGAALVLPSKAPQAVA
jgi:hypothetical protein